VRNGIALARETTGPVPVPRADVEIDFDIEDAEGFVYLWGALVRDGDAEPSFEPTISWEPLDEDSERALARAFVEWLRDIRDRAAAEGRTVLAYHYTSYETEALNRILGPEQVADVMDLFVDLHAVVAAHYFGAAGLGLKKVAPAFGFQWRDDEPSGLLSQLWYLEATQTDDPAGAATAKERLLAYNEDDVRATLAVREGMARPPDAPPWP
jgi:predicted RecB family nuclease